MYNLSGGNNKIELITNVFVNTDTTEMQEAKDWKERLVAALQKVPSKADTIKPMLEFLIATLEPSKIYMLQHNDIGQMKPDRYFDLLIVLPSTSPSFVDLEPVLEIAYLKDKRVCCSLHNEGSIMEGLKNGRLFYSLNFTPANIIYDKNPTRYPVATSEQLELVREKTKEIFTKGFEKAKKFYTCAETEFRNENNEIALFMLHQAVQLTCRSILRCLSGHNIKDHEIKILRKHVRRYAPQLVFIFNEDNEEEKELLATLEKGYIAIRYDNDYKVNANMLPLLLERVKLFQHTALQVVKQITGSVPAIKI